MKKSTLYISDLDGTLLNTYEKLSDKTKEILNRLMGHGLLFSVATARSAATCQKLLKGLEFSLPLILMNGVFLYDMHTGKYLYSEKIPEPATKEILSVFKRYGKAPFQYVLSADKELCVGFTCLELEVQRKFYRERAGLAYKSFEQKAAYHNGGEAVYYAMIDRYETLLPVRQELEKIEDVKCEFYKDNYSEYWFLETFSAMASKSRGVYRLKELAQAKKIIVFGDNMNDLDMFRYADEAYAVENAVRDVKDAATGMIGANDKDGVALFLENTYF